MATPTPTPSPATTTTDSAITDPVIAALIGMLQTGTSPQILALQQALLQRMILEGNIIPSSIPNPLNISEVGGYINLLTTLGLNQMRTQVLASALGVAPPALVTPILSGSQTAPTLSAPTNPLPTTSLTPVMAGLGTVYSPVATGRLKVTVQATISNSLATDGGQIQLVYGTGTPPSNGAAATGTPVGSLASGVSATPNAATTLTLTALITGLALGTPEWFDLAFAATTGGTLTLTNVTILIEEF